MSDQGISISTDGVICGGDTTFITRRVLPFNLQLKNDSIKLKLKCPNSLKLNLNIDNKKLNLIRLSDLKLSKKITNDLKLNLKI